MRALIFVAFALAACTQPPSASTTASTASATTEAAPAADTSTAGAEAEPIPASLPGTKWAMNDEAPNYAPTMEFAADGRVSGSAGCNEWSAPYQASVLALSFGAVRTTRRACPADATETEQHFLQVLGETQGARMEGEDLVLFDIGGAESARFHPLR